MSQPIKYLTIVSKIIQLYQTQLITLFKRIYSQDQHPHYNQNQLPNTDFVMFKAKFDKEIKKLKQIQDQKSIVQDKISDVCAAMGEYLGLQVFNRVKNTSQSERYAMRVGLRTQDTHRMRLTGGLKKSIQAQQQPINQSAQMDDIIRSYKIQQQIGPRMRMKWKSLKNSQQQQKNETRRTDRVTIGDNNIDLLSYTIPQIQNSIKRLSLQSVHSKHRSPQKIFQAYRTIDTRNNNRKKYVPRLI